MLLSCQVVNYRDTRREQQQLGGGLSRDTRRRKGNMASGTLNVVASNLSTAPGKGSRLRYIGFQSAG